MKLVGVITTAVLSLTLGVAAPAYAQEQHEQQEEQKAKPAQDEKKAQPAKPAKQAEKPEARQEQNAKPQEKTAKPEEKKAQQQENNPKQGEKSAQQQQHPQAQPGKQTQHATGRIPDDRFKANFGEQHRFRVSQADYSRDRRFQYGGYWFGFSDPWPSNWLYTQDVFVVEINGMYYLCNPMFPGVNVALIVTL